MSRSSETVEVVLQIHHETEKAYLVSETGERDAAVWLPKSMCDRLEKRGTATWLFDMPEWIAVDKGFV